MLAPRMAAPENSRTCTTPVRVFLAGFQHDRSPCIFCALFPIHCAQLTSAAVLQATVRQLSCVHVHLHATREIVRVWRKETETRWWEPAALLHNLPCCMQAHMDARQMLTVACNTAAEVSCAQWRGKRAYVRLSTLRSVR